MLSDRVTELLERLRVIIESWYNGSSSINVVVDEELPTGTNTIGSVKITDGTDSVGVLPANGSNGLVVIEPNHISTDNSTTSLLGAGEVFTGISEDITNYAIMFINVYSNVASATDGLCIQTSHNGTDWYLSECYTINADTYKLFAHQCATKYFRLTYTNGGTIQTDFHIEVKLCTKNALSSSHRISDSISDQDDASLMKAVLTGWNGTTFENANLTPSNNIKVTDAENSLAIAKGEVAGSSKENKWGNARDFDTSDGGVDIWDGAEDGTAWEQMTYVFSDSNDIDTISSTSALDTVDVNIEGLVSGVLTTTTVTLNGQNKVSFTAMDAINRMYNANGTEFVGNIIAYVDTAISGGVPTDTTKIRAIIHPDEQQTEMAVYTVPNGKTAYILGGYASTAGSSKDTNYIIKFKVQEPSGVFRTKQKVALADSGTSFIQFRYEVPEVFQAGTRIKVSAQMTATGGSSGSVSGGFSIILVDD